MLKRQQIYALVAGYIVSWAHTFCGLVWVMFDFMSYGPLPPHQQQVLNLVDPLLVVTQLPMLFDNWCVMLTPVVGFAVGYGLAAVWQRSKETARWRAMLRWALMLFVAVELWATGMMLAVKGVDLRLLGAGLRLMLLPLPVLLVAAVLLWWRNRPPRKSANLADRFSEPPTDLDRMIDSQKVMPNGESRRSPSPFPR